MSKILTTIKRHTKKIVVGTLILGSFLGVKSCRDNIGEVVYSGIIDGYEVIYEEGRFRPFHFQDGPRGILQTENVMGNVMVLKKDGRTYRFEDYSLDTQLFRGNQKNPGYLIDVLDRVTIQDNLGDTRQHYLRHTYFSPFEYQDENFLLNIKKREAEEFEYCNNLYREIRGKIQDMLVR